MYSFNKYFLNISNMPGIIDTISVLSNCGTEMNAMSNAWSMPSHIELVFNRFQISIVRIKHVALEKAHNMSQGILKDRYLQEGILLAS